MSLFAGGVASLHLHGQPPLELQSSGFRVKGPRRPGKETHGDAEGRLEEPSPEPPGLALCASVPS